MTPRLLFIDAYDSFSNNIRCILQEDLDVEVVEVKIDTEIDNINEFVRNFAAIVIGPGPGHPANPSDVGLINEIWRLRDEILLPVFGICLGFQSLVLNHGGKIEPLPSPRHGIVRVIRTIGNGIFCETNLRVVQYHSLHGILDCDATRVERSNFLTSTPLWKPSMQCPDLIPTAWDLEIDNRMNRAQPDWSRNPKAILMAVKHRTKPFFGVQFHPESICSDTKARHMLRTWWIEAQHWNLSRRNGSPEDWPIDRMTNEPGAQGSLHHQILGESVHQNIMLLVEKVVQLDEPASPRQVIHKSFNSQLAVPQIYQTLNLSSSQCIVLDSEQHQRSTVGTHSILGIIDPRTLILEYHLCKKTVTITWGTSKVSFDLKDQPQRMFVYLKKIIQMRKAIGGPPSIPFWGGMMGFISYEACLETIDVKAPPLNATTHERAQLSFALVERSVVVEHATQRVFVQSVQRDDHDWVSQTASALMKAASPEASKVFRTSLASTITLPAEEKYKAAVRECQEAIHRGDAYELCLTAQTSIKTDRHLPDPWPLYLRLRQLNPAPFSAYVRLGHLTLLSSSPERFLSWSRPAELFKDPTMEISTCQFRPIKGTVKKQTTMEAAPVTFAAASAILSTPKEKAENLMIVDLIRHDLHGVAGPGNVRVAKLMSVEEYATVFQLVTVIEGDLINPRTTASLSTEAAKQTNVPKLCASASNMADDEARHKTGIDVLAASLPPGSMTGAPKKRSCQLLQSIEQYRPRGVYSGVIGYLDVGGGGDFSVVIRSAVRWDDDQGDSGDIWTVGAGGAVTSLSTEHGEWDEMLTKLQSTLRLFEDEE